MSLDSNVVLALFLAGITWFAFVVRRVRRTIAGHGQPAAHGLSLAAVARFAKSSHDEIGAFLAANYGGNVESLPGVLKSLLDRLEARAHGENLALDRQVLKSLIENSAIKHKVARPHDIHAALAQIS